MARWVALPDSGSALAATICRRSFVGRRQEVVELSSSLDDAIAGRGRLFLISGEPGIGKTWLADELARHAAERRMRVAWGRGWEGGGAMNDKQAQHLHRRPIHRRA